MSADLESTDEVVMMCCACCGKAEVDEVKLKICTACKLVKYCSVECQKDHRPQHKKACKQRAAEIRDDRLFTQPDESHLGECPICFLPLPLDTSKWTTYTCCSKRVCTGCCYANITKEFKEGRKPRCPYCREDLPETQEETDQNEKERVKANDPLAIFQMGEKRHREGDFEGAFNYYTKAAKLGDVDAHHNLSLMYYEGRGIEKDTKKQVYHLEEAAIGGHPEARFNLGVYEERNGRHEIAVKHYIIAANLGDDESLDAMKKYFLKGLVSKDDYAASLRGHQAAVDATKSKQREETYALLKKELALGDRL
jgi:tetratricopeptide (TPR) repeat protein